MESTVTHHNDDALIDAIINEDNKNNDDNNATAVANVSTSVRTALQALVEQQQPQEATPTKRKRGRPRINNKPRVGGGLCKQTGKCMRCLSGTAYKKGHHYTCPLSKNYGQSPDLVCDFHIKKKQKGTSLHKNTTLIPIPQKNPSKRPETIAAYGSLKMALSFRDQQAATAVTKSLEALEAARVAHEQAMAQHAMAASKVDEAKRAVVKEELQEDSQEWNIMILKLEAYKEQHGNIWFGRCSLKKQQKDDDNVEYMQLFKWCKGHRHTRESLMWQRKLALEGIGFEFDAVRAEWMEYYHEDLVPFHQTHGHCRIEDEGDLKRWCKAQRKYKREAAPTNRQKRMLTAEGIELLNSIGFPWADATLSSKKKQTKKKSAKGTR